MADAIAFCDFTWTDRGRLHRCMDENPGHEEHHCCCDATMRPAESSQPSRRRRQPKGKARS